MDEGMEVSLRSQLVRTAAHAIEQAMDRIAAQVTMDPDLGQPFDAYVTVIEGTEEVIITIYPRRRLRS